MHTPTEKELQINREPTEADMTEKSDLHFFVSVFPMFSPFSLTVKHFETVEAQ